MERSILLIDDSPTIRTLIKLYLMGRPLRFTEASTGAEGLTLASTQPYDLIIADFSMPGMNGLEFLRAFRALPGAGHRDPVPVVLLTATKEGGLREEAFASGATAFLNKPVTRDELTRVVDGTLGSSPR